MSLPPVTPAKSTSGIAVDPKTLERVVPESRRPDGSIRKELRIRPGFTPQEDVTRFRGTRQRQMDQNTLPKGHILGWVPPSNAKPKPAGESATTSKSAKKNEKRKEKRDKKKQDVIKANWEDDDSDSAQHSASAGTSKGKKPGTKASSEPEKPKRSGWSDIGQQLEQLEIR